MNEWDKTKHQVEESMRLLDAALFGMWAALFGMWAMLITICITLIFVLC